MEKRLAIINFLLVAVAATGFVEARSGKSAKLAKDGIRAWNKKNLTKLLPSLKKYGAAPYSTERAYGIINFHILSGQASDLDVFLKKINHNLNRSDLMINVPPARGSRYAEVDYNTPLTLAIEKNKPEIVKILLSHKADPNKPNFDGEGNKAPLQIALESNDIEAKGLIIDELLRAGAYPTEQMVENAGNDYKLVLKKYKRPIDEKNLLKDLNAGNLITTDKMDQSLRKNFVQPDYRYLLDDLIWDFEIGKMTTPLVKAILLQHYPTVYALLTFYKVDPNKPAHGATPLSIAKTLPSKRIKDLLIEHGAQPEGLFDKAKATLLLKR